MTQEPISGISPDAVIIDGESAETAVLGVYSGLQGGGMYGQSLVTDPGVLSDEMTHSGSFPTIAEMDRNNVTSANVTTDNIWVQAYSVLYRSNNILENLEGEAEFSGLTDADRTRIIGEARFGRALALFQVANHYGDTPLAINTILAELETITRSPQSEVYAFVISEAQQAATELANADFGSDLNDQSRATRWAAKALEARARLYSGDVSGAGTVANEIIESGEFALAADYTSLFGPGPFANDEIIFSVSFNANDQNGLAFQFLPAGRFEYAVGPQLLAAMTDIGGDRANVIALNEGDPLGRHYVNKYVDLNTGSDGVIAFRLAEMYLIRAEANLTSSPITALNDLNTLRMRAGLTEEDGQLLTGSPSLDDVLMERFVELSFEGHRWFDLRRTGRLVSVMSQINGDFVENDQFLPVPQREIEQNPNLTQNPGY